MCLLFDESVILCCIPSLSNTTRTSDLALKNGARDSRVLSVKVHVRFSDPVSLSDAMNADALNHA